MLPKQFLIPDLSDLFNQNTLNLTLDSMFGGDPGPSGHPERPLWVNLVRLSDKALREYEAARTVFAEFQARKRAGHFSPLFQGIDHMENAVTATHRGVVHGNLLRDKGWGRRALAVTPRQADRLRKFRHHIEHADDKLIKGQILQGQPVFLTPYERHMEFGRVQLSYSELAWCIRKVYRQVEAIRGRSK